MDRKNIMLLISLLIYSWSSAAIAYDCSGLPKWSNKATYQAGDRVEYNFSAYEANATASKFDRPRQGDPWIFLGECGSGDGDGDGQPISIFGVWHCGNHFCDWSLVRDTSPEGEFDHANHWIIDRGDGSGLPSVNLVILSFLEPMKLLNQTTDENFVNGVPKGMTANVVNYFKSAGIRVMLSMGGITYTQSWDTALITDPVGLANLAAQTVVNLGADGFEIDYENGTPDAAEMAGLEMFIDTYNANSNTLLTMDLAVGNRYLQELSRRASADWLPNGKLDYINAMVPRGEPTTDQWQEHVDGKSQYNPPIAPKAPAKIAVSLWLTNSNNAHDNCVDFASSSQLEKADYVQNVLPNGAGSTAGFLGYMFWAAECPSTRNVCTTPPNTCENGMGTAASYFNIPIPIGSLRQD